MKFRGRLNNTMLALPLAATVAITACAPQATQQANKAADIPAVVEQVQQSKMLPVGSFAGMVATSENGRFVPVVGAIVKVEGAGGQAVTDVDGRYVFDGLKPGDYKVKVTKDGFEAGEAEVKLTPVTGTPRINVAMQKPSYALQAITAFSMRVTGVVTDPRGAALPLATVRVATTAGTGTNQIVPADQNGFYDVTIANMAASPISPGYVQITAFGTSPGGVKCEVDQAFTKPVTSASLVVNAKCEAFTLPENMTFPTGTFTPMGSTNATIEIENMSTRADEFYLRLTSLPDSGTSSQVFAVLPESITNTPAVAPANQKCNIKFRVPFAFPPNNSTYYLQIIPFGVESAAAPDDTAAAAGTKFVVNYTQNSFNGNLVFSAQTLADGTRGQPTEVPNGQGVPDNPNNGKFVAGEDAIYKLTISNSNLSVSPDIRIKGKTAVGSTIATATAVLTKDNLPVGAGAEDTVTTVTIPNGSIVQPNGTGDWSITGFSVPNKLTGGLNGKADVTVIFNSPTTLAPAATYDVNTIVVEMPSSGLTHAPGPGVVAAVAPLPTVSAIDRTNNLVINSKTITTIGDNDGIANVRLSLTPTGTSAVGAYKFTDTTRILVAGVAPAPARKAQLNGTAAKLASPTAIGLNGPGVNQDKIGLIVTTNGVAAPEAVVNVASSGWDLETLCAFISTTPNVTAFRNVADNKIRIEHTIAGTNSITLGPSTTNNILTVLGLSAAQTDSGTAGYTARYTANGRPGAPAVTQPAGTVVWGFAPSSTSSQNADGSLAATFTILPTSTVAVAAVGQPILIDYIIERQGLPAGAGQGGLLTRLGGGGAAMGSRLTAVNMVAPFVSAGKDVLIPAAVGFTSISDGADPGADI